jgi:hypothetical protein
MSSKQCSSLHALHAPCGCMKLVVTSCRSCGHAHSTIACNVYVSARSVAAPHLTHLGSQEHTPRRACSHEHTLYCERTATCFQLQHSSTGERLCQAVTGSQQHICASCLHMMLMLCTAVLMFANAYSGSSRLSSVRGGASELVQQMTAASAPV